MESHWGIQISQVLLIERNENKESIQWEQRVCLFIPKECKSVRHWCPETKPQLHRTWTEKPISLMGIPLTESNSQPASQPYLAHSHASKRMGVGTLEGWVYEQSHKTEKLPSALRWVAPEGTVSSDMSGQRKAPRLFLKHGGLGRKGWSWLESCEDQRLEKGGGLGKGGWTWSPHAGYMPYPKPCQHVQLRHMNSDWKIGCIGLGEQDWPVDKSAHSVR